MKINGTSIFRAVVATIFIFLTGLFLALAEDYFKTSAEAHGFLPWVRDTLLYSAFIFAAGIAYDFVKALASDAKAPSKLTFAFCIAALAALASTYAGSHLEAVLKLLHLTSLSQPDVIYWEGIAWWSFLFFSALTVIFGAFIYEHLQHAPTGSTLPATLRGLKAGHDLRNLEIWALLVALVAIPTVVVFLKGASDVAAIAVPLIAAVAFANLDRILKFKGVGLEFETRPFVENTETILDSATSEAEKKVARAQQIVKTVGDDRASYTLYANGSIVQRLGISIVANQPTYTALFPIAFPNACLSCQAVGAAIRLEKLTAAQCTFQIVAPAPAGEMELIVAGL
jgi:hypothetical protein